MRRTIPMTVGSLAAMLLMALACAASASADSAWWHLSSGARPTVLQPGAAKDAVQELTVSATQGDFLLLEPQRLKELEAGEHGVGFEDVLIAVVPYNASAQQLREAIEHVYPGRNVTVAEGSSAEPNSRAYVVTFRGQTAPLLTIGQTFLFGVLELFGLSGERLSCEGAVGPCTEEATVAQVSQGRPDGQVIVTASNLGDATADGEAPHQVRISDKLPPGLKAVSIEALAGSAISGQGYLGPTDCLLGTLTCTFKKALPPYRPIEVAIGVEAASSSPEPNEASVSGGEAASISIARPVPVGGEPAPFGVEDYQLTNEEQGGGPVTQAGSHPFQQTTTITLNQRVEETSGGLLPQPVVLAKDLNFKWPAGLIGNPTPFPKCTLAQFLHTVGEVAGDLVSACPANTAVGVARTLVNLPSPTGVGGTRFEPVVPLFNIEPSVGEPARFGFRVAQTPVFIDPSVRSGSDYGITVSVNNIAQTVAFVSSQVTVWGVPGDPSHDNARGYGCLTEALGVTPILPCTPAEQQHPPPLLSMPTSCTGPLHTKVEGDSWEEPGVFRSFAGEPMPALDGCNALPFSPELEVKADGQATSTPTGLNVDVHVPEGGALNPNGLANANIKDITVQFPEGVVVNPASADGLQACSESEVGLEPGLGEQDEFLFSPRLPQPFCPDASKIGTVTIKSPLLPKGQNVEGALYLANPAPNGEAGQNPFDSLIATYIVAKDPVSGVLVTLPGSVSLDQSTGRITATFENNPQLAFEDAEIHLFGGERAPFATPARCGTYTTEATYTPWSGNPPVKSSSSFNVTTGPNGGPCPSPLPFVPSLVSDTTNINAGAFSSLTTTISRDDGNQNIQNVTLHFPPGLSGMLTGIPLCREAQANAGTCGPESLIGETIVSVGLGGDPFTVTGGKVYLTEKYGVGAFGLSIVNAADAGPFHLGKVVVRASIQVDPLTAALTITTGQIPHIIDGIPLQIKHVNVTIDRSGFTFNPTNCNPMAITGTIGSNEGASFPVSAPFQITNCAALKFAPKFSVFTSGKTSKANGASLTTKLSYPNAPQGTQANITKVKVDLPKQLPSRLTTLQKACTNAQFKLNPANCPAASKIGFAKVITPLLPVPLTGPAIFVSHGGEAFPSLTMVLQGYGVTVDLVGTTFISKQGITSTTFKSVPDTPFSTFELTLPKGKFSALAANGNLCKAASKLKMPTEFVAQNRAVIHQATKIAVTGCARHKAKRHAKAGKHRG